MAKVRNGAIQFPVPLKNFCIASNWTLFRVTITSGDRLNLSPVLPGDDSDFAPEHQSSLSSGGVLWIPALLRELVSLGEQSVMMRVENGAVAVYLRKVFETLGFRP
jgi:hypothetical protein